METDRAPESRGTPPPARGPGLALAALILGLVGLLGSVVVLGALLALVGLGLGGVHLLRRREHRRMAWAGVGLSMAGVVASVGFLGLYVYGLKRLEGRAELATMGAFADWTGKPSPDLLVTTLEGDHLRLGDLKGKKVIVDFWATWCGPCVAEIPHLVRLQSEVGTNDLAIVGISGEDRAVLKPFAEAKGINYAVVSSAGLELPEPFSRVRAIPTTFFLDRQGAIRQIAVGYRDFEALQAELGRLDEAAAGPTP